MWTHDKYIELEGGEEKDENNDGDKGEDGGAGEKAEKSVGLGL